MSGCIGPSLSVYSRPLVIYSSPLVIYSCFLLSASSMWLSISFLFLKICVSNVWLYVTCYGVYSSYDFLNFIFIVYEPVQVFTLIWWPPHCKNSSPTIWIWRYPKPRLKKIVLILAFGWCKLFVMLDCYFHGKKLLCVKKGWKKTFFLQQWNCIVQFQKTNYPIIYDVMVECQCVMKCWGQQLYNGLAHTKS